MTKKRTAGILDTAPRAKAKDEVSVVRRMVPPISFMVSLIRSTPVLVWSVLEKAPEMIKASSSPTPNMMKGKSCGNRSKWWTVYERDTRRENAW